MEVFPETMPAQRKGPVKPIPQAVSYSELEAASKRYPIAQDRLLFCWLYLTGQRISEALVVTRSVAERVLIKDKPFIKVDSITLKNRQATRRTIYVPMFGMEQEMAESVWAAIENLKPEVKLFYYSRFQAFNHLSTVSVRTQFIRSQTRERFDGVLQINPHFLRHCRATHMLENHGYNDADLMFFFGWASSSMPNTYITTSGTSLAEKLIH